MHIVNLGQVAKHLSESYGDRAWVGAGLAGLAGNRWPYGKRLVPGYPYIEAEIRYAVRNEYACTASVSFLSASLTLYRSSRFKDVIGRRLRLAFLNAGLAHECLPRVVEIMASELGWSEEKKAHEVQETTAFLKTMGLKL